MTDDPRLEAVKNAFAEHASAFDQPSSERAARQFCAMIRAFLGENADRKEVMPHQPAPELHNATAPVDAGADPGLAAVGKAFIEQFCATARAFLGEQDSLIFSERRPETVGKVVRPSPTPAAAGADPPWLDDAAKAAHDAAGQHDPAADWWAKYPEDEREEWRRAARAVLRVANAQPVSEAEREKAAETIYETRRADHNKWNLGKRLYWICPWSEYPPGFREDYYRHADAVLEAAAKVRAGG